MLQSLLTALNAQYQAKIMGEVEHFQWITAVKQH